MEAVFGTNFADVRIHVSAQANAIGALAFTRGSDIHFAPGRYDPSTSAGQRMLAHELAHVVQQRAGRVQNPFSTGVAVIQNALLEAEAERMARRAVAPIIQRAQEKMEVVTANDEKSASKGEEYVIVWEGSKEKVGGKSEAAFNEVAAIVKSAHEGGGKPTSGKYLPDLLKILGDDAVKKSQPKTSEGTFAIGTDGKTLYLCGSSDFVKAAQAVGESMKLQASDIGCREDFVHGESHIVKNAKGVIAVAATQDNCAFCHGYLRKEGKEHQSVRDSPAPKGWIHPTMGFTLKQVSGAINPKGLILSIWLGKEYLYRLDLG